MVQEAPSLRDERPLGLRKIAFLVWAIGFVPLFAAFRSQLQGPPLHRSLIGSGLLCATAVAALWLLGREKHPTLRAWRVVFVLWAMLLTPLLLTIVDGIAEQGWPRGRYNQTTANVLLMVITMTVPAFVTGLCALIRTYRLAGVMALVAGLACLVDGVLLLQATARVRPSVVPLTSVLNILAVGSKVESYLAIPAGIALIVGGIMTLRAARARAVKSSGRQPPPVIATE
ncbi:MAG: hypothetical protein JW940_30290 [Polyangiaceae bacterium]|nr:hypothetical protein [Polyangiaceae bacterium]